MLFWDVDTQADFIYPDGKLYVPGAESIVLNLDRLTAWAARNGVLIIASACAHREDDVEFAYYPPHCLLGTPGQEKIPATRLPNALVLPNRKVRLPQDLFRYQQIILEKQELDVFSNPNTHQLLERLGTVREIVLYGVVTEICVACTGRGLFRRGHRLRVVSDAIRHLDHPKAQLFLQEMTEAAGELITTDGLLASLPPRQAA
jgi:nicotinamidase/pyrazinamidase